MILITFITANFTWLKIHHKITGNWSFLIITDRKDLDSQIYRNFLETETIVETKDQKENYFRPGNKKSLKEYLQSNRAFVFSLIFKFGIERNVIQKQTNIRDSNECNHF